MWNENNCFICSNCCETIDVITNFKRKILQVNIVKKEQVEDTTEEITENIVDFENGPLIKTEFIEVEDNNSVEEIIKTEVVVIKTEVLEEEHTKDTTKPKKDKPTKPRTCPHCGKNFKKFSEVHRHIKIHLNKRSYVCSTCGKAFNSDTTLRSHKIGVHGNPSDWKHVCEYCEKRFPKRNALMIHVRRHIGEKEHFCNTCGKAFLDKFTLETHYAMHTDEKSFECALCGNRYKYSASLRMHRRKVHKMGKEIKAETYMCDMCGKQYASRSPLKRHIIAHHKDKPAKVRSKKEAK